MARLMEEMLQNYAESGSYPTWNGLDYTARTGLMNDLVVRLQNNDPQAEQITIAWLKKDLNALEIVDRAFSAHLRRSLYRLAGGNSELIEDWLQDTYLKLSRSIADFQLDRSRGYFRAWLVTCARNLALDSIRRETNRARKYQEQAVMASTATHYDDFEEDRSAVSLDLQAALQTLEPRYQALLLMRFNYNMTYAEIARKLNETERTVEYSLSLAKKQLKQALE
jgi:RNA polymerase sigma-70 factor, ECF subfamily